MNIENTIVLNDFASTAFIQLGTWQTNGGLQLRHGGQLDYGFHAERFVGIQKLLSRVRFVPQHVPEAISDHQIVIWTDENKKNIIPAFVQVFFVRPAEFLCSPKKLVERMWKLLTLQTIIKKLML